MIRRDAAPGITFFFATVGRPKMPGFMVSADIRFTDKEASGIHYT